MIQKIRSLSKCILWLIFAICVFGNVIIQIITQCTFKQMQRGQKASQRSQLMSSSEVTHHLWQIYVDSVVKWQSVSRERCKCLCALRSVTLKLSWYTGFFFRNFQIDSSIIELHWHVLSKLKLWLYIVECDLLLLDHWVQSCLTLICDRFISLFSLDVVYVQCKFPLEPGLVLIWLVLDLMLLWSSFHEVIRAALWEKSGLSFEWFLKNVWIHPIHWSINWK